MEKESSYCAMCHLSWHHAISPSKVRSELAEEQGKEKKNLPALRKPAGDFLYEQQKPWD